MFELNDLRTDPKKVQEGTWVDYRGESKLFLAKYMNKEMDAYRLQQSLEHAEKLQAGGEEADRIAEEVEVESLARFVLKDWEGFKRGGEAIDYTVELGREIFSNPEFADFREDVVRLASNREHYRVEGEKAATKAVKKAAAS